MQFLENVRMSHKISLKFVSKFLINNIPALVWIMAWRQLGDKPLSEPMMVSLLTHICVTRPQWVKQYATDSKSLYAKRNNTDPALCNTRTIIKEEVLSSEMGVILIKRILVVWPRCDLQIHRTRTASYSGCKTKPNAYTVHAGVVRWNIDIYLCFI